MSANHIQKNLDSSLYDIEIFGVTKQGEWLVGDHVSNNLKVQSSIDQKEPRMSLEVLKTLNACDLAIPVFHGPEGEDGMMQGFLDTLQIPYVGCGYRGSVVCMQKAWTKYLAVGHGVPTAPFLEINKFSYLENPIDFLRQIEELLKYPVWVKPVHLGSSIGVSRVVNREELNKSIELAFICDERLIVEKEIQGRQIEFAVLGNEKIRVLNSCEILNHGTFYDYNRKYGENAIGTEIPANLTSKEKIKGFDLAKQSYLMCDCKGMARVDFFLDEEGNYWLNEINPFPGFTAQSGYPKMCEAVGLTGQSIWNELISLSFHRARTLSRMRVVG
jgi:UDP-N-acetylmuramate--alanine ligase